MPLPNIVKQKIKWWVEPVTQFDAQCGVNHFHTCCWPNQSSLEVNPRATLSSEAVITSQTAPVSRKQLTKVVGGKKKNNKKCVKNPQGHPERTKNNWAHSPISSLRISLSLSTVRFFSSSRASTVGGSVANWRRGCAHPHRRLSITLHRLSSLYVMAGQRFLRAISNRALMIRAAFWTQHMHKHFHYMRRFYR